MAGAYRSGCAHGVNGRYRHQEGTTNAVCEILEYMPEQEKCAADNARLIALAPDLAAWAAHAAYALSRTAYWEGDLGTGTRAVIDALIDRLEQVLACQTEESR
jgi:hypothetical protein